MFPQVLRQLRKEAKLTQAQLAEILKVSQVTMGRYETGEREMPYETLIKLADFFNVTTDCLLGRTSMDASTKPEAPPPTPDVPALECIIRDIVQQELAKRGL